MPIYDYRCKSCSSTYDIFHKSREVAADVICPSCGSADAKKLMSVPASPNMNGSPVSASSGDSCATPGGCCGGSCSVN